MANTVVDVLKKRLEDRLERLRYDIGSGSAKDYPEYREQVGFVKGAKAALIELEALQTELEGESDD